ncbi:hypothetical protein RCZ04_08830 [Capnocytophaga sp. HP1101]
MPFTQRQTRGIIAFLVLIIALQFAFRNCEFPSTFAPVDTSVAEREMDSLRELTLRANKDTIYPFNPNFLSDYKAYKIGLTTEQYDRLQAFRAQDRYVNSAEEFQEVTGISDSVLHKIAPSFKFPDWVKNRKTFASSYEKYPSKHYPKQDINTATADALMKIYGIGEGFSNRILKYRNKLHGFTYMEQVAEVYGLDKEVYERVAERFEVQTTPVIEKKDINTLNMYELSKIPYVKYGEGKKIVGLRSELGNFKSFDDLLQIEGFDKERIARLQLYLYIEQ